jgi:hypothetical protein
MQSNSLIIAKMVQGSKFQHYPCPVHMPLAALVKELGTAAWFILQQNDRSSFPEVEISAPAAQAPRRAAAARRREALVS